MKKRIAHGCQFSAFRYVKFRNRNATIAIRIRYWRRDNLEAVLPNLPPRIAISLLLMIIPGRSIITRNILRNILSPHLQTQPCGIDLTLRRVLQFASPGTIDLDNTHRLTSNTTEPPFTDSDKKLVDLATGAYLVEFNETVAGPLNLINGSIVCPQFVIPVWNAFERQCCG